MMEGYMLCIDGRFIFVNDDIFSFSFTRFDSVFLLHKLWVSSQFWWAHFFCFTGAYLKIDITNDTNRLHSKLHTAHSLRIIQSRSLFKWTKKSESEKNEWRNKDHFQSRCLHHFALKEQYLIIIFFFVKKKNGLSMWMVNGWMEGPYCDNGRLNTSI